MLPSLQIIVGDALEKLRELPEEGVQCCVTSPPYDNLRKYGGFVWNFEGIAQQLFRVMCEGGIVCWNVGDSVVDGSETLTSAKQKIFFREQCGFRIHDTMIWHKANFSAPSHNRYHQVFEYVFILSKGRPRTFNPLLDKPNLWAGTGCFGRNTQRTGNGGERLTERPRNIIGENGMRGNVWYGNTSGQENVCISLEHPAQMPEWLAHDLILSWSNVGDIILDPFAGSGTSGKVALELGRSAILIELNPKYAELIEQRCNVTLGFPFMT
jgi:site-specific DNA-methyltransferase (adenine-specific)